MSQYSPGNAISFKAEVDLKTKQYTFVKAGTLEGEIDVSDAGTDEHIGILQNKPELGWEAKVQIDGTSKLLAGDTISRGDELTADANGAGVGAVSTNIVRAIALEDAVVGDIFEVMFVYYVKA